jgi:hypothetical protein
VEDIVRAADFNRDGVIDIKEFIQLFGARAQQQVPWRQGANARHAALAGSMAGPPQQPTSASSAASAAVAAAAAAGAVGVGRTEWTSVDEVQRNRGAYRDPRLNAGPASRDTGFAAPPPPRQRHAHPRQPAAAKVSSARVRPLNSAVGAVGVGQPSLPLSGRRGGAGAAHLLPPPSMPVLRESQQYR